MTHGTKPLRVLSGGLVLLTLLASWSYYTMATQRIRAQRSARELTDCVGLAAQIKAIDREPKRAQPGALAHSDLTRRIELAANASGISSDSLIRIDAAPPRRLAKLPYEERPTRVSLRGVSLTELVGFLHRLDGKARGRGLWVKDLRLRAPRGEEVGDLWLAEVTLSYLIYTPKETPAPQKPG